MSRIPVRSPIPSSPRNPLAMHHFGLGFDDVLIFLMILPTALAMFISLINFAKVPEPFENRQIILDVPRTSRVDAQVTSENNTVNLENL